MNAGIWSQIDASLGIIMQKADVSICNGMFVSVSAFLDLVACYSWALPAVYILC